MTDASIRPQVGVRQPGGFYTQAFQRGSLQAVRMYQNETGEVVDEGYVAQTYGITDSFIFATHLKPMLPGETWWDGHYLPTPTLVRGSFHIHDQRHQWTSRMLNPYDCFLISLSQTTLDAADGGRGRTVEMTRKPFDADRVDAVMLNLSLALMPALVRPHEATQLFVDHVLAAVAAHVVSTYGSVTLRPDRDTRLASWQLRRAIDMMMAMIDGDPSAAELAAACGLSEGHFARAFRAAMGLPPHRWLIRQRVNKAMHLLRHTDRLLPDIALACGFADQSHLTRTFTGIVGVSPAKWRRMID